MNNTTGVTWGSGTQDDPYVIEGWGISNDMMSMSYNGISIINSTVFFIITDCQLTDYWICLENVTNGTISQNHCSSVELSLPNDIVLDASSNNSIVGNICGEYGAGISLTDSNNNKVAGNNCSKGGFFTGPNPTGISLSNSNGNTIEYNDCSYNANGIFLDWSVNNTLRNNTCSANSQCGIDLYDSSNNTLSNNTCGGNGAKGISLTYSSDNTLSNNTCSDNQYGVRIDGPSRNGLYGNNCSSNSNTGMYITYSDNSTLCDNVLSNNPNCGASVGNSRDVLFVSNTCTGNQYGIYLSSSHFNTLCNNNCSNNTHSGIRGSYSRSGALCNNTCSGNAYYGITIGNSNDTDVRSNNCSDNNLGIFVSGFSTNNTFYGNNLSNNFQYGLSMSDATTSGNRAWNNTIAFNNGSNHTYSAVHNQAFDGGTDNRWNSTAPYGNCWSDWQYQDLNLDGIVDRPYNISGAAGARDFYPLTKAAFQHDVAPPITIANRSGTPGSNGWFISPVNLTLSATDSESSVDRIEYRVDNNDWQTYEAPLLFSVDGNFSIEFHSVDRAGNNETVRNVTIRIDRGVPVTHSNVNGSKVTLIANDSLSGIFQTVYSIDGGSWRTYYAPFKITDSGNHTIEYYSIDGAGNIGQANSTWVDNGMSALEIISAYGLDIVIVIIVIIVVIAVINSRDKGDKDGLE